LRVTRRGDGVARVMLEAHYFWTPTGGDAPRLGLGPFVAIQPGEDIINAIGGGFMMGFRRADTGNSFNIGVGWVADPKTKILGAGLSEGQPVPLNAQGQPVAVRYEEDDQYGIVVLTSFAW
jgi:hypothetical protein